jgi:hypothetical protein
LQGDTEEIAERDALNFLKQLVLHSFDFSTVLDAFHDHFITYVRGEGKSEKQKFVSNMKSLVDKMHSLRDPSEKFLQQLETIFSPQKPDLTYLVSRIKAASNFFESSLIQVCTEIYILRKKVSLLKKTKNYVEELEELDNQLVVLIQNIQKSLLISECLQSGEILTKELWNSKANNEWRNKLSELEIEAPKVEPKKKKVKGETYEVTLEYFNNGMSLDDIVKERNLAQSTIVKHFTVLIEQKKIQLSKVMTDERRDEIIFILKKHEGKTLSEIVGLYVGMLSYEELRLVIAHMSLELK